jgi:hypothetical protein
MPLASMIGSIMSMCRPAIFILPLQLGPVLKESEYHITE